MQPTTHKTSTRTKTALWLLIGPTALIVISLLLYAIVNLFMSNTETPAPADGQLFAEQSTGNAVINTLLFLVGVIGSISWLPGLITGIVLLATAKK